MRWSLGGYSNSYALLYLVGGVAISHTPGAPHYWAEVGGLGLGSFPFTAMCSCSRTVGRRFQTPQVGQASRRTPGVQSRPHLVPAAAAAVPACTML